MAFLVFAEVTGITERRAAQFAHVRLLFGVQVFVFPTRLDPCERPGTVRALVRFLARVFTHVSGEIGLT